MDKSSLALLAMSKAREIANARFAGDHDRSAKIKDAISMAWVMTQKAPSNATEFTIARYAVMQVVIGRQFGATRTSLDGPNLPGNPKPSREFPILDTIIRDGDDPAEIACFRLTFRPWLKGLPAVKRRVAIALMHGDRTSEVARRFHLSSARVSQIRRELMEDWIRITS